MQANLIATENRSAITWGGDGLEGTQRSFGGVMDMFIILMEKASQCIHIPKLTKLYTLEISSL